MENVEKLLDWLCVACTIVFFLAVTLMVLGQAAAVVLCDGALSVALSNAVAVPASMVSAVATVIAIVLAYLRGQMKS